MNYEYHYIDKYLFIYFRCLNLCFLCVHTFKCVYLSMCVCVCVCIYLCVCVCVCVLLSCIVPHSLQSNESAREMQYIICVCVCVCVCVWTLTYSMFMW